MAFDFVKFFQDKLAKQAIKGIPAKVGLYEWLYAVEVLYEKVETILSQFVTNGSVKISRRTQRKNWPYAGEYDIDELVVSLPNEKVIFYPSCPAVRRVDVVGNSNIMELVMRDGPSWQMRIGTQRRRLLDESDVAYLFETVTES